MPRVDLPCQLATRQFFLRHAPLLAVIVLHGLSEFSWTIAKLFFDALQPSHA